MRTKIGMVVCNDWFKPPTKIHYPEVIILGKSKKLDYDYRAIYLCDYRAGIGYAGPDCSFKNLNKPGFRDYQLGKCHINETLNLSASVMDLNSCAKLKSVNVE